MSAFNWIGQNGTTEMPTSGRFDRRSNWEGNRVPGAGDAAVLADGSYTVSVADYSETLQSMNVGVGATLRLLAQGLNAPSPVAFAEQLDIAGTLMLAGSQLADPASTIVEVGAHLIGHGTVGGAVQARGSVEATGGNLTFVGNATFSGKVAGRGGLTLNGGNHVFDTDDVSVSRLRVDNAHVNLGSDFRYNGHFTISSGTIDVDDSSLATRGVVSTRDAVFYGGGESTFFVGGELHVHDGQTEFATYVTRIVGTVTVSHGSLIINSILPQSGEIIVGTEGLLDYKSFAGPGPLVVMSGHNATLRAESGANGVRVAEFDARDRIELPYMDIASASKNWLPDKDGQGGYLVVGQAQQHVHLEENHSRRDFRLVDDGHGGTLVLLKHAQGDESVRFGSVNAETFGTDTSAGSHPVISSHELHSLFALV